MRIFPVFNPSKKVLGSVARRCLFSPFLFGIAVAGHVPIAHAQQDRVAVVVLENLIRSKQYDRAVEVAQQRLRESPRDYRIWTLKGIALSLKGSSSDAVIAFVNALRISPDYGPALKGQVQVL